MRVYVCDVGGSGLSAFDDPELSISGMKGPDLAPGYVYIYIYIYTVYIYIYIYLVCVYIYI